LAQVRHQRGAQLLVQWAGPQIIIGDHILHVGGAQSAASQGARLLWVEQVSIPDYLAGNGVVYQVIRDADLLNPQQTRPLAGGALCAALRHRQLVIRGAQSAASQGARLLWVEQVSIPDYLAGNGVVYQTPRYPPGNPGC
jgi:uncharacterized lipoprotein YmbA